MGRTATDQGGYEEPPTGNNIGRCYRIIDLGTQHGEYQGTPQVRNQVFVGFELPECLMEDGRPFTVGAFWTNSLGKKATLRAVLNTWRNKPLTDEELAGFDLEKILTVPGIVTLTKTATGKIKVAGVGPLMKGMKCPPQVNPTFSLWIDEWDQVKFDSLPDGIKDIIKRSDEYKARFQAPRRVSADDDVPAKPQGIDEDDIPFVQNECTLQPISKLARRMLRHDTR